MIFRELYFYSYHLSMFFFLISYPCSININFLLLLKTLVIHCSVQLHIDSDDMLQYLTDFYEHHVGTKDSY